MGKLTPVKPLDFCVYNHVGEATCTVDLNQRLLCWNPVAAKTLGYDFDDVFGKQCWDTLHGETENGAPFCRENCPVLHQVALGKPVEPFNVWLKDKNGSSLPFNVSAVPVYNHPTNDKIIGMVHLMRPANNNSVKHNYFRVHLLGTVDVQRPDGTHVESELWRRIKTRMVLAYLALHYDQPVSRDVLAELFWSHLEYEGALRNLNTTIYNLRRSLEPDLKRGANSRYVIYESGSYRLKSDDPFWLDVTVFEETVRQARQAKNIVEAIRLYEAAHKLYRGDYLQNLYDAEPWQTGEQTRLRELHLTILEELAGKYIDNGELLEARDIYLSIMAKDPCRESSCLQLVRLEIAMGNRALARSHCLRLRKVLHQELGVSLPEEIQSLCQQLT